METYSIKRLELQIDEIKEKRAEYKKAGNIGCIVLAGGAGVAILNIYIGLLIIFFGAAVQFANNNKNKQVEKVYKELDAMIKARRNLIVKMSDEDLESITADDIDAEEKRLLAPVEAEAKNTKITKQDIIFYGILLAILAGAIILIFFVNN